jgi:hypothetical protein
VRALAAAVAALAAAGAAAASIWTADGARAPSLRVDARGNAEVSWTEGGARRTLLVPPSGKTLPGGRLPGPDVSRPARVPGLALARVLRRTPDGRLWALQEWQVRPGGPSELHLARWRGAPTKLTLALEGERLSGRATFQGKPVAGRTLTPEGKRPRIFVYLDCFGCPAASGGGWARMLGIAPRADGTFAVRLRPSWRGTRYRATVAGPNAGETLAPDARAEIRR